MSAELIPSLPWLDWALLAVLALSLLVGVARGLVFECLSLAGWVVAWFSAQWAAPQLAPFVPVGAAGTAMNLGVALVLCFVAAFLVWALLARLVRLLVHATPLSLVDRLLGAGFGLLRGVVLLLAVATVVGLTPASQSPGWRASQGARWLGQAMASLKPMLPEPVARLVRT